MKTTDYKKEKPKLFKQLTSYLIIRNNCQNTRCYLLNISNRNSLALTIRLEATIPLESINRCI